MTRTEAQRVTAEFLGSTLLLVAVVGSGIVTSTDGAASVQLFQHAVVVGAALVALILAFGPVSGAHFNPVVTAADWWFGGVPAPTALRYVAAQLAGAITGTIATNATFGEAAVALSDNGRDSLGLVGGEGIATFGLLVVIFALVHTRRTAVVPAAVGVWIAAAIFSTSSASFANPVVTVARMLTDTYAGIAPGSVPGFLAGQALGGLAAVALVDWLYHPSVEEAHHVVVPHDDATETEPIGARPGGRT